MKTVFTNSELAHIWYHASQEHGRTSNGSFYFQNDVIYSYGDHYPIARKIITGSEAYAVSYQWAHASQRNGLERRTLEAGTVVLFNSEGSSPTTEGKHKNEVRRAIPSGVPVFRVPYLTRHQAVRMTTDGRAYNAVTNDESDMMLHDANIAWYQTQCEQLWTRKPRERKGLVAERLRKYIIKAVEFRSYCEIFKGSAWVNEPTPNAPMLIPCAIDKALQLLDASLADEREYLAGIEARRGSRRPLFNANGMDYPTVKVNLEEAENHFRAGEALRGTFTNIKGFALLRVKGDNVQTSQGAIFPVVHAAKALRLLGLIFGNVDKAHASNDFESVEPVGDRAYMDANPAHKVLWKKNGHSIHLGHYLIDQITDEHGGLIYAGCHKVLWSEVLSIHQDIESAAKLSEVSE